MAILVDDFLTMRHKSHIYFCTYPSLPVHLLFSFGTTPTGKPSQESLGSFLIIVPKAAGTAQCSTEDNQAGLEAVQPQ